MSDEMLKTILNLAGGPALVAAVVKYLFGRFVKEIDIKFDKIANAIQKQNEDIHGIQLKLAGYEVSARTQEKLRRDIEEMKEKVILQGSQIDAAWREIDGTKRFKANHEV